MYYHVCGVNCFSREPLPGHWDTDLDSFQKMIVLKCIRLDRLTNAMQDFVSNKLGQRFIEPQTADLGLAFKDSSPTSPLIFILSTVSHATLTCTVDYMYICHVYIMYCTSYTCTCIHVRTCIIHVHVSIMIKINNYMYM